MSTILKALRRLEEEKQARAVERDLREAVAAGGGADRGTRGTGRLRGLWVGLAVAFVSLGVFAAGWWAWPGTAREAAAPAVAGVSGTESARSPDRIASPSPAGVRTGSPRERPAPPPVARRAPPEASAPVPVESLPSAPPSVAAAPPAAAAGSSGGSPGAVSREPAGDPDFAVVEPTRAPETAPARVVELDRVDGSVLTVSSTVWHPSASRRSARVELEGEPGVKELREGDELGGFTILEIEPAGVTFVRRGVRVHRRVGEH